MVFTPNDPNSGTSSPAPSSSSTMGAGSTAPISVALTPEQAFLVWAPENSVWSAWTKPVIFAQVRSGQTFVPPSTDPRLIDTGWAPMNTDHTAVILDLPAEEGVLTGLALAMRGFRPIPLYNSTTNAGEVVTLSGIVSALYTETGVLDNLHLPSEAPPVFLLDSNRLGTFRPSPGQFDNRWAVFPQDFPSAIFLRSQGITRMMLVKRGGVTPLMDLVPVLSLWQKGGIEVLSKDLGGQAPSAPIQLRGGARLWMWSSIMMWSTFGFRRSSAGGFGSRVPIPSSSSG